MAEHLDDFFSDNAQWVEPAQETFTSALPPEPPKSRRDMRRHRAKRKHRRIITWIAVIVVVALIAVGSIFGIRMLKHWKAINTADEQIQVEDYSGPGDQDVSFTVESGQGASEIAQNLVKADIVKSVDAFTNAVSAGDFTLYPGTYSLKTHMKASDVAKILSDQSQAGGFVEVRAGERVSDVITAAAQASGKDVSEFQSVIDGGGDGILPKAGSNREPMMPRTNRPKTSSRPWWRRA